MDRFWVFLEALARCLENGKSMEELKRDLSQMPQSERERMTTYLQVVSEKIHLLAGDHA
jgi:hypothetical protein